MASYRLREALQFFAEALGLGFLAMLNGIFKQRAGRAGKPRRGGMPAPPGVTAPYPWG